MKDYAVIFFSEEKFEKKKVGKKYSFILSVIKLL